ncbi:MAG: DUF1772 domain-containing protein [Acidobacteriota bacterium]|nr:DUF1772 domain-containing protein [Acidobacteriota bacterium]
MEGLAFISLVITGVTSCAEFGSYAFVHPVIRRLPHEHHIRLEQGLLKTFGRVMPVAMTLCVILSISYATRLNAVEGAAKLVRWAAAASLGAALISTIIFNVPTNLATGRWSAERPPERWKEERNRWEFFQGLRSWLLLIGFVLLCLAVTLQA